MCCLSKIFLFVFCLLEIFLHSLFSSLHDKISPQAYLHSSHLRLVLFSTTPLLYYFLFSSSHPLKICTPPTTIRFGIMATATYSIILCLLFIFYFLLIPPPYIHLILLFPALSGVVVFIVVDKPIRMCMRVSF